MMKQILFLFYFSFELLFCLTQATIHCLMLYHLISHLQKSQTLYYEFYLGFESSLLLLSKAPLP